MIFSAFITKNAIVITVLDVSTSLVRIRSSPYFLLPVPILPSITERFLRSDLNSSCCSAVYTSAIGDATCTGQLHALPIVPMFYPIRKGSVGVLGHLTAWIDRAQPRSIRCWTSPAPLGPFKTGARSRLF